MHGSSLGKQLSFAALNGFLFLSNFLPKIAWNITASPITWDNNNTQKHLHPATSSFKNSTFKFCFKHKLLSLYHPCVCFTGHPVTLPICVSTKKTRFYLHPITPKMALVCLASPLVTQPTHVARTGDILPSANLGMTGAELGRVGWRESSCRIGDMILMNKKTVEKPIHIYS